MISRRVPSSLLAERAHRDVGVAAERAFLHVAVADADPAHQRVQRLGVGDGFGRRAHVGLGDDLQQRRAGAVEVDARLAVKIFVQRFAGVLLQVRARQLDRFLVSCSPWPTWIVSWPPTTTGSSYWLIW